MIQTRLLRQNWQTLWRNRSSLSVGLPESLMLGARHLRAREGCPAPKGSVFFVLAEGKEKFSPSGRKYPQFFFALRAKIKQKTTEFDVIFVDGMG